MKIKLYGNHQMFDKKENKCRILFAGNTYDSENIGEELAKKLLAAVDHRGRPIAVQVEDESKAIEPKDLAGSKLRAKIKSEKLAYEEEKLVKGGDKFILKKAKAERKKKGED